MTFNCYTFESQIGEYYLAMACKAFGVTRTDKKHITVARSCRNNSRMYCDATSTDE